MSTRQLIEKLNRIIAEDYEEAITLIKKGKYKGEDLADIVLQNINSFSVEESTKVLNSRKYYEYCKADYLFPSEYWWEQPYPTKLAEALAKSKYAEAIPDIYNIFYRSMFKDNLAVYGDAIKVWEKYAVLPDELDLFLSSGEEYFNEVMSTLYEHIPEVASRIENACINYSNKAKKWIEKRKE